MVNIIGAKILEIENRVQYQSYIKVQLENGQCYVLTISNSNKFILNRDESKGDEK